MPIMESVWRRTPVQILSSEDEATHPQIRYVCTAVAVPLGGEISKFA